MEVDDSVWWAIVREGNNPKGEAKASNTVPHLVLIKKNISKEYSTCCVSRTLTNVYYRNTYVI